MGRRDQYSPFRETLHRCKKICSCIKGKNKICEITLEDIKEVWDAQNGICPITGWKMILQETCNRRHRYATRNNIRAASLDRIDNNKGYIKGNIRFVCNMANICRNRFEDEDVIEFCKAVCNNVQSRQKQVYISQR